MLDFLKSTILSKIVVALTGLILVGFIVGHTLGNLLIYLGQDAINQYAADLASLGSLLWVVRIVLLIAFVLHIIATIYLVRKNKIASGGSYKVKSYKNSTFSSRFMIYAGLMVFFFVIYHLAHFTFGIADPEVYNLYDELNRHDVYNMVIEGFKSPIISAFYIIAVVFLGLHLNHGVQSMFHTLGFHGKNFSNFIRKISPLFAAVITLSLTSIPLTILLGLIGA